MFIVEASNMVATFIFFYKIKIQFLERFSKWIENIKTCMNHFEGNLTG